ncbi:di/tricarboxylate transporter [Paracoccus pantotrophus]|uniref:Di/tricarboxylate transporter n=1 Tax=Paracoccus pantotrophus TaxID=82367 RepID=A0AAE6NU38_PARPN|nr:SLC13 family permease [Paracoccus pantotrophus]QFG35122.1 SLC13 family permease [Paracoccus pantotrophus]RKS44697.1 di/tricarboxylate transporter [Paracoccus pantotrophus]
MAMPQLLAVLILCAMMVLFVWGRLRYDVVAMIALLASLVAGTVKPDEAFRGFSDDIVIIVGSALVVSAGISRSGVIEAVMRRMLGRLRALRWQLLVLVGSVTGLSALVKNIGALAMLMPAALKMARRSGHSPSAYLMPMAFGSLLGGLITLVGTSPNIIVSRVREQMTGQPFTMFDYAPVGLGLSLVGLVFLLFAHRLLPRDRRATASLSEAVNISDYHTEATVPEGADIVGMTVGDYLGAVDGEVAVTGLIRGDVRRAVTLPDTVIRVGDTLLLRGEPNALERAVTKLGMELTRQDAAAEEGLPADQIGVIEAVIAPASLLVGQSVGRIALFDQHGVNLIAISRAGHRMTQRLSQTVLAAGDVLLVQGPIDRLPERMRVLGLLPLAERHIRLGGVRKQLLPVLILTVAMAATAAGLVPVAIAFFAAAVLMILTGTISAEEAYEAIEWPILVMLGALIPVSEALQKTGVTELLGAWLSQAAMGLPVWGAVTLILVAAMAVTPFLNNAATVLVMAPIAATFASELGYRPDAFLMAVAVGAGCDFLTPIGHQCNTLVMGPGGYRFGDYARLGAPLSVLVVLTGVPLILMVWPV